MRIRNLLIWISLIVSTTGVFAGANFQISFKVIDDFGEPIRGATVMVHTFERWKPGDGFGQNIYKKRTAVTDANGMARLAGFSKRESITYGIHPQPGYYYTTGGDYSFKGTKDGKWQPWNPTVELVFKPIVNPIPMYAKVQEAVDVPESGRTVGYDLMEGDWVAPYGKGNTPDFLVKLERQFESVTDAFDARLTVTFSNDGDGILPFFAEQKRGSTFRSPRFAPEDGYEPQLTMRTYREAKGKPIISDTSENRHYFFRVRTVKEDGEVKSALYGKIYRDLEFWGNGKIRFRYYLNPEPNSRNMEFDPQKNLKGLKITEQPNAP